MSRRIRLVVRIAPSCALYSLETAEKSARDVVFDDWTESKTRRAKTNKRFCVATPAEPDVTQNLLFHSCLNIQAREPREVRSSVADVRHEGHEASALDSGRDSVLADGGATGLTTADDLALTAGEFLEEFDVLVVDEHGAHAFAVRAQRIALLAVDLNLGALAIDTILF